MTGKSHFLALLSRFVIVYFEEATKLLKGCIYGHAKRLRDSQVHALVFNVRGLGYCPILCVKCVKSLKINQEQHKIEQN